MPKKFTNKYGQIGMEFMALTALFILGIITMGPYVVRSINSHFKTIEQGATDAHRENIRQAPVQFESPPQCDCTWIRTGCGTGAVLDNGQTCTQTQAVWQRSCTPIGCEDYMRNIGVFNNMQECRDEAMPTSCCLSRHDLSCSGHNSIPGVSDCSTGKRLWYKDCGSPTTTRVYNCEVQASCAIGCEPLGDHAQWCDPAHYATNATSNNQAINYVNFGDCHLTSDMTCKAQCKNGYSIIADQIALGCCEVILQEASYNQPHNAGTIKVFTSPVYNDPVQFNIDTFTEDLNYVLMVFDKNHNLINFYSNCADQSLYTSYYLLHESYPGCDARDSNGDINHATFKITGNQIILWLKEGGNRDTSHMGWDIHVVKLCY